MNTALVIDDSRQSADSLCQMLKLLGIEPIPAYGARAAMILLSKRSPDIIFMDVHMAGVDGFEVLSYLRRIPQLNAVPVVFVTSDDQPEVEERARESGALGLVVKPPTFDILEAVLKQANIM